MLFSGSVVDTMQLEVRKNVNGDKARILGSSDGLLPDGPYLPVIREGDYVTIADAVMYVCAGSVHHDHCPWEARLSLKRESGDKLEGTIEVRGVAQRIESYQKPEQQLEPYECAGRILLRRVSTN